MILYKCIDSVSIFLSLVEDMGKADIRRRSEKSYCC